MKRNHQRVRPFDLALHLVLALLALLTLYPFYNVLILSFSNIQAISGHTPYLWFWAMDLEGYRTIVKDPYFFSSLGNTLFVTIIGTSINMLLSVAGAYVLSKKKLPARNALLTLVVIPMLFSGGMIPIYLVMKDYRLIDSIWSMILPCAVSSYYVIIMKNYFRSISPSLEEAAVIDGANDVTVLLRVILPISLPFTMTFFLFYAVERWNEWWNAYLYISERKLYPLQIYLREVLINMNNQLSLMAQIKSGKKIPAESVQMATIIITALPILCVYPFIQKYFVKGVMIGSIKE
ncbi:MAG: carbohydrate ABC transporter permease [Clostridia bacterium]|nr:carbohydrate ABC transporter permease [Clostridia bacterium]